MWGISSIANFVRSIPVSRALPLVAIAAGVLIALWLIDKIFIYYYAASYIDEISSATGLNRNLARALSWIVFAILVVLGRMIFSTSRSRRRIGAAGFLFLLVGQPLVLFMVDKPFDTKGRAQKCYIITRDDIRYGEQTGRDPNTGLECKPLTPEIAERFEKYRSGERPRKLAGNSAPTFFSERTGNPVVWYSLDKNGVVQAFDMMGFDPDTGEELQPVTKEIVSRWQTESKAPELVSPLPDHDFFDRISGKPRVWYLKIGPSQYEFYNREGYDPKTGERMMPVDRTVIEEWKKTLASRCYVLTARSVKYRSEPGIDPETGRECRPFTPDMLVRLREYEQGKRPEKILAAEPTFFDARSGDAIIWYAEHQDKIDLFDLMGFHPDTGAELLPVTKDIVARWKEQRKLANTRAPVRVDFKDYVFFDPKNGNPRAWFWKSPEGNYEFYDAPGFHPRTGDQLAVLTKELLVNLEKQARQQLEEQKRQDDARKADELRRQQELAKASEAGRMCDELAGNPNDGNRVAEGVPFDSLKIRAADALAACELAVRQSPAEKRYQYQLARVLQISDRKRSGAILSTLVAARYPAAFDNYGWMAYTDRKNPSEAVDLFRRGIQLNDSDSMVSLAEMIDRGFAQPLNPSEQKIALYQRAADLGHKAAERAVQVELGKQNSMQIETAQRLQQQQMMVQMFGTILQGIGRR